MRLSNSFGFTLFLLLLREKHEVFLLICLFLLITKVFLKSKRILFGKNIRWCTFKIRFIFHLLSPLTGGFGKQTWSSSWYFLPYFPERQLLYHWSQKYFLNPQNNFKCVKISPNLMISEWKANFCKLSMHIFLFL